jgi:hypothetical protein
MSWLATEALQKVPIIQSVTNEIRDNSTVITFIGDVDNNGYTFEDSNGSRWLFCKSITETGDVTQRLYIRGLKRLKMAVL